MLGLAIRKLGAQPPTRHPVPYLTAGVRVLAKKFLREEQAIADGVEKTPGIVRTELVVRIGHQFYARPGSVGKRPYDINVAHQSVRRRHPQGAAADFDLESAMAALKAVF